jgi:hypothetical protein
MRSAVRRGGFGSFEAVAIGVVVLVGGRSLARAI